MAGEAAVDAMPFFATLARGIGGSRISAQPGENLVYLRLLNLIGAERGRDNLRGSSTADLSCDGISKIMSGCRGSVNALHSKKSRYDRKKHSEAAQYEQKRVLSGSVQDKYSLCLTNVTVQTPADIFLPWVSGSLVATDEIEEK
jgi:hypothetical protein